MKRKWCLRRDVEEDVASNDNQSVENDCLEDKEGERLLDKSLVVSRFRKNVPTPSRRRGVQGL